MPAPVPQDAPPPCEGYRARGGFGRPAIKWDERVCRLHESNLFQKEFKQGRGQEGFGGERLRWSGTCITSDSRNGE
jgi:hypothetical protein